MKRIHNRKFWILHKNPNGSALSLARQSLLFFQFSAGETVAAIEQGNAQQDNAWEKAECQAMLPYENPATM